MLDGHYRAVYMTPEMYFGGSRKTQELCKKLWGDSRWKDSLLSIVVDEVHCVERWGMETDGREAFRPEYSLLGQLRSQARGVPIVGVSATLDDTQLAKIKRSLFQYTDDTPLKLIEVEDMRDNLRLEIRIFSGHHRVRNLASMLDGRKTLVYFDTIRHLRYVQEELRKLLPKLRIGAYYSTLRLEHKEETMDQFKKKKIDILLATDAAGMGCDIPDVAHVIQYE